MKVGDRVRRTAEYLNSVPGRRQLHIAAGSELQGHGTIIELQRDLAYVAWDQDGKWPSTNTHLLTRDLEVVVIRTMTPEEAVERIKVDLATILSDLEERVLALGDKELLSGPSEYSDTLGIALEQVERAAASMGIVEMMVKKLGGSHG